MRYDIQNKQQCNRSSHQTIKPRHPTDVFPLCVVHDSFKFFFSFIRKKRGMNVLHPNQPSHSLFILIGSMQSIIIGQKFFFFLRCFCPQIAGYQFSSYFLIIYIHHNCPFKRFNICFLAEEIVDLILVLGFPVKLAISSSDIPFSFRK